jgi:DNA-binding NarL/FixJ family response regulator
LAESISERAASRALVAAHTAIVADSHPLSLDSLGRVVLELGIQVSARETRIERIAELVAEHDPDLLVLGVDAVDVEVQHLLQVARRLHQDLRIVLISDDDPWGAQMAFDAGTHAYCDRTASEDDLAVAIRQSFERSIHLRPLLADPATTSQTEAYAWSPYLTRREAEILRFVAEGRTNEQIAKKLWVTLHTVKFHLSNIYRKLNVSNRTAATHWAERHGVFDTRSGQAAAAERGSR